MQPNATHSKQVLLNCDMGESYGAWQMGQDADIMPYIDCCNIACGFHAGDPSVMKQTLLLAKTHNVEVGAHPGFPDMQGFGRRAMHMSPNELTDCLHYQIAALSGVASTVGNSITYVKPHGAMYNQMMRDDNMMHVIMQAVIDFPLPLALMIQATGNTQKYKDMANQLGLSLRFEAFSDRAYQNDGSLVPRGQTGALLGVEQAIKQCQLLLEKGQIISVSGKTMTLDIDTICIHGDTPNALQILEGLAN